MLKVLVGLVIVSTTSRAFLPELIVLRTAGNSVQIAAQDTTVLHAPTPGEPFIATIQGKKFTKLGTVEQKNSDPQPHLLYKNYIGHYQNRPTTRKVFCNGPCLLR